VRLLLLLGHWLRHGRHTSGIDMGPGPHSTPRGHPTHLGQPSTPASIRRVAKIRRAGGVLAGAGGLATRDSLTGVFFVASIPHMVRRTARATATTRLGSPTTGRPAILVARAQRRARSRQR